MEQVVGECRRSRLRLGSALRPAVLTVLVVVAVAASGGGVGAAPPSGEDLVDRLVTPADIPDLSEVPSEASPFDLAEFASETGGPCGGADGNARALEADPRATAAAVSLLSADQSEGLVEFAYGFSNPKQAKSFMKATKKLFGSCTTYESRLGTLPVRFTNGKVAKGKDGDQSFDVTQDLEQVDLETNAGTRLATYVRIGPVVLNILSSTSGDAPNPAHTEAAIERFEQS